jgi:hypothetical protein
MANVSAFDCGEHVCAKARFSRTWQTSEKHTLRIPRHFNRVSDEINTTLTPRPRHVLVNVDIPRIARNQRRRWITVVSILLPSLEIFTFGHATVTLP